MKSETCALCQELSQLNLGCEAFQHSLLEFCHVFEHFEELLSFDYVLHRQEHLVDSSYNIED